MRANELVTLVQFNDPEYTDTGGIYNGEVTVIARAIPASVTSMQTEVKLLMNQDIQMEDRYLVQHKFVELKEVRVDAVYRHSQNTWYYVYRDHRTGGIGKTCSLLVEYRDTRRTEWTDEPWQG